MLSFLNHISAYTYTNFIKIYTILFHSLTHSLYTKQNSHQVINLHTHSACLLSLFDFLQICQWQVAIYQQDLNSV